MWNAPTRGHSEDRQSVDQHLHGLLRIGINQTVLHNNSFGSHNNDFDRNLPASRETSWFSNFISWKPYRRFFTPENRQMSNEMKCKSLTVLLFDGQRWRLFWIAEMIWSSRLNQALVFGLHVGVHQIAEIFFQVQNVRAEPINDWMKKKYKK